MKKIIQTIKETFQNWKLYYYERKRLKEFEREFYKEFPRHDDNFNLISITIALVILLALIILSIIN